MPIDLFQLAGQAIRLAQTAGPAARLAAAAREAITNKDPEAIAYLIEDGWKDGLEVVGSEMFGQPGLGQAASSLVYHANQARREVEAAVGGDPADGYGVKVLTSYPWDRAFNYLDRITWGSFTIVGPKGEGKTELAKRLAEKWHRRLGYEVETVGMYPGDRPSFANGVLPEEFVKRAMRLRQAINAVDTAGRDRDPLDSYFNDEEGDEAPKRRRPSMTEAQAKRLLDSYGGRIVIFDEVGLNLGRGGGMSALRNAMLDLFNQSRHLDWIIIYCAQSTKQIPEELLNGQGVMVKRPLGDEAGTDRDRGPTRDMWLAAMEAFANLRSQPGYSEMPDPRAWAWLKLPEVGGNRRQFQGLAPFYRVGHEFTPEPDDDRPDVIIGEFREVVETWRKDG